MHAYDAVKFAKVSVHVLHHLQICDKWRRVCMSLTLPKSITVAPSECIRV